MNNTTGRDRFRGCLLGLAAGDALGTANEFKDPGTFEPIPSEWRQKLTMSTEITSMADNLYELAQR